MALKAFTTNVEGAVSIFWFGYVVSLYRLEAWAVVTAAAKENSEKLTQSQGSRWTIPSLLIPDDLVVIKRLGVFLVRYEKICSRYTWVAIKCWSCKRSTCSL